MTVRTGQRVTRLIVAWPFPSPGAARLQCFQAKDFILSAPGKRTVSHLGYKDYIRSDAWRSVKKRYLQSKNPKEYYGCLAPYEWFFHFHHRTYKNLGNENLRDIIPVCPRCHELIHETEENRKWNVWRATRYVRRKFYKIRKHQQKEKETFG